MFLNICMEVRCFLFLVIILILRHILKMLRHRYSYVDVICMCFTFDKYGLGSNFDMTV